MKNLFEYQKPTDEQIGRISIVRELCLITYEVILAEVPDSPQRDIAITKLEEASMWANKAIVFN